MASEHVVDVQGDDDNDGTEGEPIVTADTGIDPS